MIREKGETERTQDRWKAHQNIVTAAVWLPAWPTRDQALQPLPLLFLLKSLGRVLGSGFVAFALFVAPLER